MSVPGSVITRKGEPADVHDFSRLIALSDPIFLSSIFGSRTQRVMESLFRQKSNLFSFEFTYFIDAAGKRAGMVLGYSGKQKSRAEPHTALLLIKYMRWGFLAALPAFLRAGRVLGKVAESGYYVSNLAVYPEFRRRGLGTRLLLQCEREAKTRGASRILLDVDVRNSGAVRLYGRMGYIPKRETPLAVIVGKPISFFRMEKSLERSK